MDTNSDNKGLKGKVVVITGASSGVGLATALQFARHGTLLVLAARREEALATVVAECKNLGATAVAVKTDVTDAAAVKKLAAAAHNLGGRIDVWVNNAGVLAAGSFTETPVEVHDQVIRTNLMGYVHGAYAVLPYFKQQAQGILINNISVGGWFPTPYAVGYSASKFGVKGFSEALRGEMNTWTNIHVCDVFPAFLDTPGIQHAANYTGTVLRPAPPVYDPQRVARTIVSLALHPKPSATVGSMASVLKFVHFLFPGISRRVTAGTMETYFRNAEPIEKTPGNLFEPVEYGSSIHGGWSKPADPGKKKIAVSALVMAGVAAGCILLRHRLKA